MIYEKIKLKQLYPALTHECELHVYCCETANDAETKKYPAMIICPGGGYSMCAKCEGEPIMTSFFAAGVQCFILRYTAVSEDNTARYPTQHLQLAAAFDYVRENADKYRIDKNAVGLIGFSAGGHLAGSFAAGLWYTENYAETLGVKRENLRPNASALGYPVLTFVGPTNLWTVKNLLGDKKDDQAMKERLSYENIVGEHTPPTYIWHTCTDDIVPIEGTIIAMGALSKNKVPFTVHVFPEGGHGLSRATRLMGDGVSKIPPAYIASWMNECVAWFLRTVGYEENPA
ncbi:MAG: alpha/beta hydrolase [Clostridia bacterium]|nr:alpha/beta hydrolase [Clostridia bacterium]